MSQDEPEYVIVMGDSYVDLQHTVNAFLDNATYRYTPTGGIHYLGASHSKQDSYAQALSRGDEKPSDECIF